MAQKSDNQDKNPEKKVRKLASGVQLNLDADLKYCADQIFVALTEFRRIPKDQILKEVYLSKYTVEYNKDGAKVSPTKVNEDKVSHLVYRFENKKRSLVGYVGKDIRADGQPIIFLVIDKSRLKWAELEGFTAANGYSPQDIFDKIGVVRRLADFDSFVNFIAGQPGYKMVGEYIVAGTKTDEQVNL